MPRKFNNNPNVYCYICGEFTTKSEKCQIKDNVNQYYFSYFNFPLGHQDKAWALHVICTGCDRGLWDWVRGKKKSMLFAIPMIWRIPKNHHTDWYFCSVNVKGFSKRNKNKLTYPSLESAIKPVPYYDIYITKTVR